MEVSSRDLRNRTAEILRLVEAGEDVTITSNRRPVARLVPLDGPAKPTWVPSAVFERLIREAPLDAGMFDVIRENRKSDPIRDPWDDER